MEESEVTKIKKEKKKEGKNRRKIKSFWVQPEIINFVNSLVETCCC